MQDQPFANNNNTQFDQVPLTSMKGTFNIAQFPDGHDPNAYATEQNTQQNTQNMTLTQKLHSKTVKIRLEGLDQLKNYLDSQDFDKLEGEDIQMCKIVKQNNPACLEKALGCMIKWVENGKNWTEKQIKQVIESGYINGKGNAKKVSVEVVDLMFENKSAEAQAALVEGLKAKTPKIIGGYLGMINQIMSIYGIKKMNYLKPYIADVVKVMNNEKLPIVKNQGMNLLKAGYKWLGKDFFATYLKDLKENIKKQLDSFWDSHDKNQQMSAPKGEEKKIQKDAGESSNSNAGGKQVKKNTIDIYDISEPLQVLKQFDERWTESVLNAQKWSIKVQMLQQCCSKISVPKIMATQCRHIMQMIRRLLSDSNFNVVLWVLRLAGFLAKGLRRSFSHQVKILLPLIITKLRDKKTQMIEQTLNTLNQFYFSVSLQDIQQDIKSGLKDKTPSTKHHLINWMGSFLQRKFEQCNQKLPEKTLDALKSMTPILQKLVNDPNVQVRDSTVKLIGKIKFMDTNQSFTLDDKNLSKTLVNKISDVIQENQGKMDRSRSKLNKGKSQSKVKKTSQKEQEKCLGSMNQFMQELPRLTKKLNDTIKWQNRKQTAQYIISFFQKNAENSNKIPSSTNTHDYLTVIKARIADPNKQLIKIFINLIGATFENLNERQAKIQYRQFVPALFQALSDKNQGNRKQIYASLDKMGKVVGQQAIISVASQNIQNQNSYRSWVLEYVLLWDQTVENMSKTDLKDYPKAIISCLCDKNRQVKSNADKLFRIIADKVGPQAFKSCLKDVKPAFKNDLSTLLDKHYNSTNNDSFFSSTSGQLLPSRKASPSIKKKSSRGEYASKSKVSMNSMNNSRSKVKNNMNGTMYEEEGNVSNASFSVRSPKGMKSHVNGDQLFAPLTILTAQRLQRQEKDERYRNNYCAVTFCQQIKLQIHKNFNYDILVSKMFSDDYRKILQAKQSLIKVCKDVSIHAVIRQIYDLILKWIIIKLYGGNQTLHALVHIVPSILSILEKKRIAINDRDVDLLICILREYVISAYGCDNVEIDVLQSIMKMTVSISSGEKVLRKILLQFKNDFQVVHRHCKKNCNDYYKDVLIMLCGTLIDYFSNDSLLSDASKIPELAENSSFVGLLKNKFHEGVLQELGFTGTNRTQMSNIGFKSLSSNVFTNDSRFDRQLNAQRSLSKRKTPNKMLQRGQKTPIHNYNFQDSREMQQVTSSYYQNNQQKLNNNNNMKMNSCQNKFITTSTNHDFGQYLPHFNEHQLKQKPFNRLDLSKYTYPNVYSPLGSNLQKLNSLNQSAINFFVTLIQENGQKITEQLSKNCNIIYGCIFNNLIQLFKQRDNHSPEKIVSFSSLVQQAIKCPHIFKKLDQQLIFLSAQFVVYQLVYEDQNRNCIQNKLKQRGYADFKNDSFIKAINGIMLRILDNTPHLSVITLLLEMLTKTVLISNDQNKKITLLIRCIVRVSANSFNASNPVYRYNNTTQEENRIYKFLMAARDYMEAMGITSLVAFEQEHGIVVMKNSKNQQSIAQTICSILKILTRELGKEGPNKKIWKIYKGWRQQMLNNQRQVTIHQYLEHIAGEIQETEPKPNYIENFGSGYKQQYSGDQALYPDETFKKILDLLSKSRTFQEGIQKLKEYISRNRHFNLQLTFEKLNLDKNFIQKVKQELRYNNYSNPQQNLCRKDGNSVNPDIQNKLQSLKKKLEGVNGSITPSGNRQKSAYRGGKQQNLTPKNGERQGSKKGFRANSQHNDVKKRIQDMKNKINGNTNKIR